MLTCDQISLGILFYWENYYIGYTNFEYNLCFKKYKKILADDAY